MPLGRQAVCMRFHSVEDLVAKVIRAYELGNEVPRAGMISHIQLRNLAQALVSVSREPRMKPQRNLIQAVVRLEDDQRVKLKRLSARTKIPMAQLIRRSVDCALELHKDQLTAP